MLLVLAPDGVIEKFPYNLGELRGDNPQTSFPEELTAETLADFGVHVVEPVAAPEATETQRIEELPPQLDDGVWHQRWQVVDIPIEQLRAAIPPISMRQARLALLGAGLLTAAEAALDALPSPDREAALIEWEYAAEVRRDHPLIAAMAAALELTEEQVDDLFGTAAAL